MELSHLPRLGGWQRKAKRIGRGYGSGKGGHTVGRGQKGQKARRKVKLGFEGGQLPLGRRLPVRKGFHSGKRQPPAILNIRQLSALKPGTIVTVDFLRRNGFLPKGETAVKILGNGRLPSGVTFKGVRLSRGVRNVAVLS